MSATLLRRSLFAFILSVGLNAQTGPPDFESEVQPLLNSCLACHSEQLATGGLALDSREGLLKGGTRGPAATPGHPEQSLLIEAVKRTGDLKMPPGRALDSQQVDVLERWIQAGLPWGEKAAAAGDAKPWAFRVPQRPVAPSVQRTDWVKNPIDRFILAKLEAKDIAPAAEADREALLRRVSLDITGLLPTPEEIESFLSDTSPNAYEKVVDRLLASDHYGERWGRHWLDLARYADSDGYSIDGPRPIWPYRDWVVNAINADKPFTEFVIEQIAGDLLPNPTKEQLIATGFNRNTPLNFEGGIDQEQYRIEAVADRVATTGSAFMGLTIGCARCHDHKYDPLKQKEFYQLFAFYNNTVEISTLNDRYKFYEPMLDLRTPKEDAEAKAYWSQVNALSAELVDYIAELQAKPRQADDPPLHKDEGLRARMATLRDIMRPEGVGASYRWKKPFVTRTLITREREEPRETFIHIGGDFLRHGEKVEPGVPAALSSKPVTGNRLDLAKWLVSRDNPLTARVTLNRMWQRYFGKGIVETENDFGAMGNPPTHPGLLDWLAVEFMEKGWSQKAMHRLIVTSAAYRQSSANRPELEEIDPYNNLLARQARIRLDAEIVRDAALSASGLLAPELGGPGVYPPIPNGAMAATQITRAWPTSKGPDRYRRGLYTVFFRQSPPPSLVLFDAPNAAETCTRRVISNSPLQALTLLNDQAFLEFAIALGKRTMEEAPADDDRTRLDYAFLLALNREPLAGERDRLATYLAKERAEYQAQPAKALELVSTLAEGSTDPDSLEVALAEAPELAAWASVGRVLLNLDDFMTRE